MSSNSDPSKLLKQKSLVEYFQSHTSIHLTKTGKNYSCPCPFHSEKESSFYIDPIKNRWTCYGSCQLNGDLTDFVCRYKNFTFTEALNYLCPIYGIEYNKKPTSPIPVLIKEINNFVAKFYETQLENPLFQGKDYLINKRKQNLSVLKEFSIGYAPSTSECGWDLLYKELIRQKFSIELAEKIGLIKKSDKGSYYDTYHGRIIFPIHNLAGDVIGFNTRLVVEDKKYKLPRYLLSLETEVFSRKEIYYGLHLTKKHIEKKNICVLVEGIFDFLRLYEQGIKNCIPLLGGQLNDLKKVNITTYYLMMDADKAGINYNSKIGSRLIRDNKVVRICKNNKDPDDLTRKEIISSIKGSEDFIAWYVNKIYKYEDSIEHKLNVLNEVSKLLVGLPQENILLYGDWVSKRLRLPLKVCLAHLLSTEINYKEVLKELFCINENIV